MKKALAKLFGSRKFVVALAAVVAYVGSVWGFDVDPERIYPIMGIVGVWLGAQGAADFGKESKALEEKN